MMKNLLKNTPREAHHSTKAVKVMVMFIFFSLVLIGSVSAVGWDNKLIYSKNDMKINLTNWFGFGTDYGSAELKSHKSVTEIKTFGFGKEEVVMYYDFDFRELYQNGLGEVEFTDMNTGKQIQKDYSFVEWVIKDIEVIDYETVCGLSLNGTTECSQEIIGTSFEKKGNWEEYNSLDIPKGKVRIGLKTYVGRNDYVDGIWTIAGKKVKKHITWAGNIRNSLTSYYKLDEVSGTVIDSVGTNNATNSGATTGATGIINDAYDFDGTSNYVVGLPFIGSTPSSFSFQVWANLDDVSDESILSQRNSGDSNAIASLVLIGGVIRLQMRDSTGGGLVQQTHQTSLSTGNWYHIVGTYDSSSNDVLIYLNGVVSDTTGNYTGGAININRATLGISAFNLASAHTNGKIDEAVIWVGRAISQEEVTFLFGAGNGCALDDDTCGVAFPTINLDSPEDNANFTLTNNVTFNATIFDDTNITNVTLWIDNQINATNTTAGLNDTLWTFDVVGFAEGDTDWTFEACNFDDICGNASARTFNINTTPDIQYGIGVPVNEFNSSNDFFEVNVTITEDLFKNITFDLYNVNGALNQSVTFTNSSRNKNWTNLPDATYSYNVTIATSTNQFNSTATRNISVDSNSPVLEILAPPTTVTFHEINTNLFVNWSINDSNLDTCILEYEGSNTTLTCSDNTTTINITTISNRTIIIYANDTFGNTNSTSRSWDYTIFQNSLTFVSETIGGSTEDFTLNITKDSSLQISTVDLVYNLSSSSASFTSGDTSIITKSLDIPNPSADINFSFYFSFLMSDAQIINTTSNNQTVLNFAIGNCDTFTTLIYNFTLLDEENQTELLDVTIDYAFNLFDDSRETKITNFSESSTANPTAICINQNLTTSTFSLDGILKYISTNGTYLTRYYNILNFSLTNDSIPNDVNLYDVLDTTATPFQLTFRDSFLSFAPSILVNVNKQFVASNDFKTVEIPLTDTNGQTILNLVRNTAVYNLIFIDIEGNIVASFNSINAFCQDFTIGQCTLDLDAPSITEQTFNFSESTGISYSIEYVNSTSIATFTFNSINSTAITARIVGTTQNQFGNQSVCDNSLTSTLGTLTCNASAILITDNLLFIDIFSNGEYVATKIININPSNPLVGGLYGSNGYFIAFMLLLLIIILFSDDKQILLVMLGMGWATILIFGLVRGTIIGSVSGGIWLLVSIITMLWKLKKEEVGK